MVSPIKNMQQFKGVIRVCIDNGWMEKDSLPNFKLTMKDAERGYLSPTELKIIEEVQLSKHGMD